MKASKAGCFVTLVFAVIIAVLGVVMFLLPTPVSPVTVSGTPRVYTDIVNHQRAICMEFTLINESDKDVTITHIEVHVSTNNGSEGAESDESIRIKSGESVPCDDYYFPSYNSPTAITKIVVKINGTEYYAYGNDPGTKPVGFVFFVIAAIFAVLTIVCFVGVSKQNKRYQMIAQEVDSAFGGKALFVVGQYGKKGNAGKAAAKTAASVLGGAVFAGLFGFGVFKVYGANSMKEFVVTDDRLLVGNPMKSGFSLNTMDYMGKAAFSDSEITVKKKIVTLKNKASGEYFMFNLTSNGSVTPEQLTEKLNKLIAPVENNVQGEVAAENAGAPATDNSDPFDL